jgi:hypothetical protein
MLCGRSESGDWPVALQVCSVGDARGCQMCRIGSLGGYEKTSRHRSRALYGCVAKG